MDYKKIYDSLCRSRKYRGVEKESGFEVHHITPRSMRGSNEDTNLVKFTFKEHYIAHRLLTKIYPDNINMKLSIHTFTKNGQLKNSRGVIQAKMDLSKRYKFIKYLQHSKRLHGKFDISKIFDKEEDNFRNDRHFSFYRNQIITYFGKYRCQNFLAYAVELLMIFSLFKAIGYRGIYGVPSYDNKFPFWTRKLSRTVKKLILMGYLTEDYLFTDKVSIVQGRDSLSQSNIYRYFVRKLGRGNSSEGVFKKVVE